MPHLIVRLAVAILTFTIGLATATIPTGFRFNTTLYSAAEREVLEVEQAYINAHIQRDTTALDRILADDFTIRLARDRVTTKAARLSLLENPDFTFMSIDTYNVKVQVSGDEAVVTGRAILRGRHRDREFSSPTYGFTRTYEKRQGHWQIVNVQITLSIWR